MQKGHRQRPHCTFPLSEKLGMCEVSGSAETSLWSERHTNTTTTTTSPIMYIYIYTYIYIHSVYYYYPVKQVSANSNFDRSFAARSRGGSL